MIYSDKTKRTRSMLAKHALPCLIVAFSLVACMGLAGCASNSAPSSSASSSADAVAPVESSSSSAAASAGDMSIQVTLTESVVGSSPSDTPLQFSDEQTIVAVADGATALDALNATGREVKTSGSGDSIEIVAIGGLENGAAGDGSHWEYSRNGEVQAESAAVCPLSDGDELTFDFVH